MNDPKTIDQRQSYDLAALFSLGLRLVTGWTYFSAFWRRLVLEQKLDPDTAGYIGEKFNHFLPNALLIKPLIEYLVTHQDILQGAMWLFTIVEAIVGLAFMLGLFTRLMSVCVSALALGILLGAGWLGTTCLDEWQIGVLGVAAGFTVFLSGGGRYALDHYFFPQPRKWSGWLASGVLPFAGRRLQRLALTGAVAVTALTLFTNQYFHGGVWGKLHNLSVKPHLVISEAMVTGNELSFTVFRDQGADVYGSFLIGMVLRDQQGHVVLEQDGADLAALQPEQIRNKYVAAVRPGKYSLVIPLGAKANLRFPVPEDSAMTYTLELTDISGLKWEAQVLRQ